MIITEAKYYDILKNGNKLISCKINDVPVFVPLDPANTHYAEMMRQVDAGELTIEPADSE